jgi:hypothetical protein
VTCRPGRSWLACRLEWSAIADQVCYWSPHEVRAGLSGQVCLVSGETRAAALPDRLRREAPEGRAALTVGARSSGREHHEHDEEGPCQARCCSV